MEKQEERICGGCLQPIQHHQPAVAPSWGFGWYHKLCWEVEREQIRQEHLEHDAYQALKGGD